MDSLCRSGFCESEHNTTTQRHQITLEADNYLSNFVQQITITRRRSHGTILLVSAIIRNRWR